MHKTLYDYQAKGIKELRRRLGASDRLLAAFRHLKPDPGRAEAQAEAWNALRPRQRPEFRRLVRTALMAQGTDWTVWDTDCRAVVLCAPCGAGKTVVAATLIRQCLEKGGRAAFCTNRRQLVVQTMEEFDDMGIDYGVLMGRDTTLTHRHKAAICSIQTLQRRGLVESAGTFDLVVVDEVHQVFGAAMQDIMQHSRHVVGLTATPITDEMWRYWSDVVNLTTTDELLESGRLAPLRTVYPEDVMVRREGVGKDFDGEFNEEQLALRVRDILHKLPGVYLQLCEQEGSLLPTVAFMPTAALCREFAEAMTQATGLPWRSATYLDGDGYEDVEAFKRGDILGLVTCDKLATGFDARNVLCLIDCFPVAASLARLLQRLGRGMRTAEGKIECIVLDVARNMQVHSRKLAAFWSDGPKAMPIPVPKGEEEGEEGEAPTKPCLSCDEPMPIGLMVCPECGALYREVPDFEENITEDLLGDTASLPWEELTGEQQFAHLGLACVKATTRPRIPQQFALQAKMQFNSHTNRWPRKEWMQRLVDFIEEHYEALNGGEYPIHDRAMDLVEESRSNWMRRQPWYNKR